MYSAQAAPASASHDQRSQRIERKTRVWALLAPGKCTGPSSGAFRGAKGLRFLRRTNGSETAGLASSMVVHNKAATMIVFMASLPGSGGIIASIAHPASCWGWGQRRRQDRVLYLTESVNISSCADYQVRPEESVNHRRFCGALNWQDLTRVRHVWRVPAANGSQSALFMNKGA